MSRRPVSVWRDLDLRMLMTAMGGGIERACQQQERTRGDPNHAIHFFKFETREKGEGRV